MQFPKTTEHYLEILIDSTTCERLLHLGFFPKMAMSQKISLKNKQKYSSAVDGMLKYSNMALKRYSFYSGKMKQNLSFPKNNPQLT